MPRCTVIADAGMCLLLSCTVQMLQAGNGTVVSVLLARGAASQIRLPDSAGESPLVLAGRNGHAQVHVMSIFPRPLWRSQ